MASEEIVRQSKYSSGRLCVEEVICYFSAQSSRRKKHAHSRLDHISLGGN